MGFEAKLEDFHGVLIEEIGDMVRNIGKSELNNPNVGEAGIGDCETRCKYYKIETEGGIVKNNVNDGAERPRRMQWRERTDWYRRGLAYLLVIDDLASLLAITDFVALLISDSHHYYYIYKKNLTFCYIVIK